MRGYIFLFVARLRRAIFLHFPLLARLRRAIFSFSFLFLRRACFSFLFFPLARLRRAVSPFCPPFRIPKNPVKTVQKNWSPNMFLQKISWSVVGGGASPNPDHLDSILRYYLDSPPPPYHTLCNVRNFDVFGKVQIESVR